jgi:2-keto-3-deoxy-6-phosphogluconate aldolase
LLENMKPPSKPSHCILAGAPPAELALLAGLLLQGGSQAVQVALRGAQQQHALRALARQPPQRALQRLRVQPQACCAW